MARTFRNLLPAKQEDVKRIEEAEEECLVPQKLICPGCGSEIKTEVILKRDACTAITALLCCFLCLWPCALFFFCVPKRIYVVHNCPRCKERLLVYLLIKRRYLQ